MKKYALFLVFCFLSCSDIARSVERERAATRFCGGDLEPSPRTVHRFKNGLLFCHHDEHFGQELFFSFGIKSGTKLVADLNPGSSSSRPRGFFEIDGSVFFVADTPEHGVSLWSLTNVNTKPKLIFAGISEHEPESSTTSDFTLFGEANGDVFFRVSQQAVKTDGTPEGTSLLGVGGSRLIGDSLYFITGDISSNPGLSASEAAAAADPVLNRVDAAGNMFVVKRLGGLSAYFTDFTLMGKAMIYSDFSFATEREGGLQGTFDPILFLTDGTTEGTDIAPQNFGGIRFQEPEGQVGNTLFFTVSTLEIVGDSRETSRRFISTTDGIVETEIQELEPNLDLTLNANTYRASDPRRVSEGTVISDGVSSHIVPIGFRSGGGDIFFQNKMIGRCLDDPSSVCASQGTSASFEKIATFDNSFVSTLTNFAQTQLGVYFEGAEGELWITDGSVPGTRFVKGFGDNTSLLLRASRRNRSTVSEGQLGEKLFFQTLVGDGQESEIWVTDGSEAGTFRVRYFYDDGTSQEIRADQPRWIASILDLLLGE